MKKTDPRVVYSKNAIREAFISLLWEKPVEHISVTEICKLAGINRGTFYAHYNDVYDLRAKLEQKMGEIIRSEYDKFCGDGDELMSPQELLCLIKNNESTFRMYTCPNANSEALHNVTARYLVKYIKTRLPQLSKCEPYIQDALRAMTIAAVSEAIVAWFRAGMPGPPEKAGKIIEDFMLNGMNYFIPGKN